MPPLTRKIFQRILQFQMQHKSLQRRLLLQGFVCDVLSFFYYCNMLYKYSFYSKYSFQSLGISNKICSPCNFTNRSISCLYLKSSIGGKFCKLCFPEG